MKGNFLIEVDESGGYNYLWKKISNGKLRMMAIQDIQTGVWSQKHKGIHIQEIEIEHVEDWSFKCEELTDEEVFALLL